MNENVNVCITPKGDKPVLHFSQFDNERVFTITVLADDGESAAVLTGLDIEFRLRKTDSHVVTIAPESVADNVITFKTTEQLCACCGQNIASVVLMKDDMIISTLDILVDIQRDILSGGLTSESDIRNLTTQIEQIVPEVIGDDYYNKQEVDDLIAEHTFDPSNYYDKNYIHTMYWTSQKTDILFYRKTYINSNYYTKTDVDDLLSDKADADDVYTKTETENLLADKANKSAISSLIVQKDVAKAPIASFNTDLAEALTKIIVDINPVQDLHGYSKPWSGGGGKNKFNCTATTQTVNGVTFTVNDDGTITANGTATANAVFRLSDAKFINNYEQGTFILNGCPTGGSGTSYALDSVGTQGYEYGNGLLLVPLNNSDHNIRCIVYSGYTANNLIFKPMIRLATETDATFEPYSNICPISGFSALNVTLADGDMQTVDTATVNFGQTVYGGVADVTNGKLTITHGYKTLDGTENWQVSGSGDSQSFYLAISDMESGLNLEGITNYIKTFAGSTAELCIRFGYNSNIIFIYSGTTLTGVTDLASFKTYLSNNNLQICYPLATPIEITTTPENLTALSGQNNVYHDCNGDTEVRFTETIGNELGV